MIKITSKNARRMAYRIGSGSSKNKGIEMDCVAFADGSVVSLESLEKVPN